MSRKIRTLYGSLGLLLVGVLTFSTLSVSASADELSDQAKIYTSTNQARADKNLTVLKDNVNLDKVAQNWAQYMGDTGDYRHETSAEMASRIPGGWSSWGENIAYVSEGQGEAQLFDNWMHSSGHYANIVGNYTDIGVGFYVNPIDGRSYGVQIFANYPPVSISIAGHDGDMTAGNANNRFLLQVDPASAGNGNQVRVMIDGDSSSLTPVQTYSGYGYYYIPASLDAGTHTATVQYAPGGTVEKSTDFTFETLKQNATIDFSATLTDTNLRVKSAISNVVPGNVNVVVDGNIVTTTHTTDGSSVIASDNDVSGLAYGDHRVNVVFTPDSPYDQNYTFTSPANKTFNIAKPVIVTPPVIQPPAPVLKPVVLAVVVNKNTQTYYSTPATVTFKAVYKTTNAPGKIVLKEGAKTVTTLTLKNGIATVAFSKILPIGAHTFTATYVPTPSLGYVAPKSVPIKLSVKKIAPKVAVKFASTTVKTTQNASAVYAINTGTAYYASGSVQIKEGSKVLTTFKLSAANKGSIRANVPRLKKGTHYLTFRYVGNSNINAVSTSQTKITVK